MKQVALFSLTARTGVTRRAAAEARKRLEESAAARAARMQREKTLEHEVRQEFRACRKPANSKRVL